MRDFIQARILYEPYQKHRLFIGKSEDLRLIMEEGQQLQGSLYRAYVHFCKDKGD